MEKSMPIAVVAIIISVVATISAILAVILRPTAVIGVETVGTDELADDAVTNAKIADDAVGSAQISDGSIVLSDLSSDVTSVITGVENIADNSITSEKIADGTIVGVDIANNAVGSDHIIDNSIAWNDLNSYIMDAIVAMVDVADNSITSAKIQDGTITSVDISNGAVFLVNLAAEVLARMPSLPIATENISDNSITSAKIVDGTITSADLADGVVTSAKIADGTVSNADISATANIDPSKISGTAWTSTNDGSGSGLDADKVDGLHGTQFLRNDTSGTINGNLTINGRVTTDNVVYSSPHTHYFVVGGEDFYPSDTVTGYINSGGNGGVNVISGSSGTLVAPVYLPHGANVTAFKVFFYDTTANNVSVSLRRLDLANGGYNELASASSSGISGYGSQTDTSISWSTINNTAYSYHISATWVTGDPNVEVMGALVTYTIGNAP